MKIIVASQNPVKLNATSQGFKQLFPNLEFDVNGRSVSSGVADQPRTEAETLLGVQNRVEAIKLLEPNADYWVGIEGGVADFDDQITAFAWIAIHSRMQQAKARTGTFFLPPPIAALVRQGKELGEADDLVFGTSNSKHNSGAVGLLTNNLIDRTNLYTHAVILALIPFNNPDLYLKK